MIPAIIPEWTEHNHSPFAKEIMFSNQDAQTLTNGMLIF